MEPRLVYCYPVRLAVSAPPMPSVEMHMENNVVCIRYKGEMVKVSRNYFSKLVRAGVKGRQVPPRSGRGRLAPSGASILGRRPARREGALLKAFALCPTVAALPLQLH